MVPAHIAPSLDFDDSLVLVYLETPSIELREKIRFIIGNNVLFRKAKDGDEVSRCIRHWRAKLMPTLEDNNTENLENDDLEDHSSDAPVIKLVNHLFARALDLNASDIHFEPGVDKLDVRCRVDGIMTRIERLPGNIQAAVISRLKLMAKLDIGEKRLPQDGRIQYLIDNRQLDLRVSTLPGVHGESVVLRILDRDDVLVNLENLGMPARVLVPYNRIIQQPYGLILITGPTGSGKTTTLYATLDKIYTEKQKIITVEDPVEYQIAGITQIQVNTKIGLNFASGLRSIVRQDPDILMIGEIRDHETAEIAIESALTGHQVFSTLHTNDAAGAISRLQDMGIESYLISSSLLGVQAQRLVRKVCPDCSEKIILSKDEADVLAISSDKLPLISRGVGCERCGNTGYRGRIGIYELLKISDQIRHLIATGADSNEIRKKAIEEGMITLRQDALDKLTMGITTPEEIVRVTREI